MLLEEVVWAEMSELLPLHIARIIHTNQVVNKMDGMLMNFETQIYKRAEVSKREGLHKGDSGLLSPAVCLSAYQYTQTPCVFKLVGVCGAAAGSPFSHGLMHTAV